VGDGSRIEANYIVLATGSSYSYPARPHLIDASVNEALGDLRATHEQLERAESVLILGAGPVGLELSGEIHEVWPDKHVTLVDRSTEVLPGYLQEVRDDLHRQLEALGIDLRLGTSIAEMPPTPEGTFGNFTITTTAGDDIKADIWFRSFGSQVNTGYLADGALTTLGDIADLADPKMATWTPLGTGAGVGQLPNPDGSVAPAPLNVVIDRKGRDLFTARFAERFHQEQPIGAYSQSQHPVRSLCRFPSTLRFGVSRWRALRPRN
jgi:apoptosis-inducing factor 2